MSRRPHLEADSPQMDAFITWCPGVVGLIAIPVGIWTSDVAFSFIFGVLGIGATCWLFFTGQAFNDWRERRRREKRQAEGEAAARRRREEKHAAQMRRVRERRASEGQKAEEGRKQKQKP